MAKFDGKKFGEDVVAAVKEYVEAMVGAVNRRLSTREDFFERRLTSTDELLDDFDKRIQALEQRERERERDAPRLRQVN